IAVETRKTPHETLAEAAKKLAAGLGLRESLELVAAAVAESTGAALAAVRLLDPGSGAYVVRAAAPADSALAAQLLGSRVGGDELEARAKREGRLLVPTFVGGRLAGALELVGVGEDARELAELAAAQLALALRQLPEGDAGPRRVVEPAAMLERIGEALAAGATLAHAAQHAAWAAVAATGADSASVWRASEGLEL